MTTPRILVVPGGSSIGAVALANAAIHKLVELYEERAADPTHPAPHTVVVLRDPAQVEAATLRGSALTPEQAFPTDLYPDLVEARENPHFFDGIDLVVPTSGSSAGTPRLVGLSIDALIASATATHLALSGPGRWVLALPTHHIAGAMVLVRAAIAETNPQIVDTSAHFDPRSLLPAVAGATQDDMPGYLSLVPTQLAACLEAGEEVIAPMRTLSAILVGGASTNPDLLSRAHEAGLKIRTTYGMTETAGGCVYDGYPLPGTTVRAIDWEGRTRLAVHGPTLMTRYLSGDQPFFDEGGHRWLLTGDLGLIRASGRVEVRGRADDVITSGGLSISPGPVRRAVRAIEGVEDAWIVPTPDEKWGQIVTALIIPEAMPTSREEMTALGQRVRTEAAHVLGRVQSPRRVIAVDALPYLGFDKIDRAAALALAEAAAGGDREWQR